MVALFGIYRIVMSDMPFCCQRKAVSFLEKGRIAIGGNLRTLLCSLGSLHVLPLGVYTCKLGVGTNVASGGIILETLFL